MTSGFLQHLMKSNTQVVMMDAQLYLITSKPDAMDTDTATDIFDAIAADDHAMRFLSAHEYQKFTLPNTYAGIAIP